MTTTIEDILADPDARFTVDGYRGITFYAIRAETAPDEDTDWTGIEEPTGNVIMIMVGDDRKFSVDPGDVTRIADEDYCSSCGQIGCTADAR